MSAKDGQSYADILREMKAKVNPRRAGLEVLSIQRTRKEEVLLVLKKGAGDVSAFREELARAVGERAEISALVSTRSLKIRDLDETVEKEEVASVLCLALRRPLLDGSCRLFTRFGGVKTAVIRLAGSYLAEADATRPPQLGKVKIGWVACRIREHAEVARCFRCLGYGHGSRGCGNPDRKNACWKCSTTGHFSSSCKARSWCLTFLQFNLRRGKNAQDLLMQNARERGPTYCSLVSSTNGLIILTGIRMHQGGPASLFLALI